MISRYPIDLILLLVVAGIQAIGLRLLLSGPWGGTSRRRRAMWLGFLISIVGMLFAVAMRRAPINGWIGETAQAWIRGFVVAWALASCLTVASLALYRGIEKVAGARREADHSPGRRAFLQTAQATLLLTPTVATGYGVFLQRHAFRLREQDIRIPNLPAGLNGLRLVQVTDIHLSPYLSVAELDYVIGLANETKAHVALVTGDLITTASDPLETCLTRLTRLRSDAGTYGCLGNHEVYAGAEEYVEHRGKQLGLRFLRQQAEVLRFGGSELNLVGVDYQPVNQPYLAGTEKLLRPGAFNLLLSHNPDVFPVAAQLGFPLTLSGHTHGGQIRFEILHQNVSLARFLTPYVDGLYEQNGASIWVSRGIGTIGIPARLGAPPEVVLVKLWRS